MPLRLSGSTGVSGIDGTAQAPAVQGTNPNAGIYYSGNNVIVSTSGNTALTVGPSGNVAISNSFSISGQFVSAYSGMMKNRIINGDMRIDQRFNGAANNSRVGIQYVVDRWYAGATGAARFRSQQNNTNGPGSSATQTATGFPNYFGANVISSNASYDASDTYYYAQPIEGLNIFDLGWGTANAAPVTLSFWVYSSIPGSHSGTIANGPANRSYPFTYTISTANTWQYQTITIPGDTTGIWFTNNNIGMYVSLNMGSGSTYTTSSGNSWQAGYVQYVTGTNQVQSYANGSFYLTGVQLEKGSQATAFDFRHYTTELQLCQRYYIRRTSGGVNGLIFPGGQQSAANSLITDFLPVSLRATPTFSWDGTTSNWYVIVNNSTVSLSSLALTQVSNLQVMWLSAGCSTTATYATWLAAQTANAWLAYSAELVATN